MPVTAKDAAERLKFLSNIFVHRDWVFTNDTGIDHIRYTQDITGRNVWWRRISREVVEAFKDFFVQDHIWMMLGTNTRFNLRHLFRYLILAGALDNNLPDGVLKGGGIITFWAEDGEYIELVPPSVGDLLADFLLEDPDNPHAQKISAELQRIVARIRNEEDTDGV